MKWLDVCGPPGVGKSTLCDPLWGPHDIPIADTEIPPEWTDFANEVTRLFGVIREHPTLTAAVRMNRRSFRKMAVVHRANEVQPGINKRGPYVQTGFVQRGLGFGWRLVEMGKPIQELSHFFRLMPVSIGVVFLECDTAIVKGRNIDRESVKETAHENRSHMVDLMQPAIRYAKQQLGDRGVPIMFVRTDRSVEEAREELLNFAAMEACDAEAVRYRGEIPPVQAPVWW